jgi:protein involved in polysaccharide export with SLBB domain
VKTVYFALLVVMLVAAGCGGSKPEPEMNPTADPLAAAGRPEEDIWLPEPRPYEVRVGDVLDIKFFYYPQYDITLAVRPDGMVTVPLIGDVNADGVKPEELAGLVKARYAEVLAEPEVSVIVTRSPSQRVFVFGEVDRPGAYTLDGKVTLIDAIAQAGGVLATGRKDNIILMRRTDDDRYAARRIDLDGKVQSDDTEFVYLVAADIIYVPMTAIAKVDVFVDQFFNKLSPAWRFYIWGREAVDPQGETFIGQ